MKKIAFIFGTRPEGIKMAPVINEFQNYPQKYELVIVNSGQHIHLLNEVLDFFGIVANYNLGVMQHNQTLHKTASILITQLYDLISKENPDLVFVQGDTTTVFAAALASFYCKKDVAHIEAGLRSGNIYSPWPEEIYRKFVSSIAKYNFVPTEKAMFNLMAENYDKNSIFNTGNTIVDALNMAKKILAKDDSDYYKLFKIEAQEKFILVTTHRRENFDKLPQIIDGIVGLADMGYKVVYSLHPNPNVYGYVKDRLSNDSRFVLCNAIPYRSFLWLMEKCSLIATDSGGIQEEATVFHKPTIVLRDTTERMESVDLGYSKLVGDNPIKIREAAKFYSEKLIHFHDSPYGDGLASKRIREIIGW